MSDALTSWNDGAARQAIVAFVERAVSAVPVEERVAVFDNDGTLWCEKPLPIQADYSTRRTPRSRSGSSSSSGTRYGIRASAILRLARTIRRLSDLLCVRPGLLVS